MKLLKNVVKIKLMGKIALILILLIIISSAAIGIASTIAQYQALIDDTGKRLTSIAHYAANHIDGDDLAKITNRESIQSESYARVQTELKQMLVSANKIPISQIAEILRLEGKAAGKNLKAVYAYTLRMD